MQINNKDKYIVVPNKYNMNYSKLKLLYLINSTYILIISIKN